MRPKFRIGPLAFLVLITVFAGGMLCASRVVKRSLPKTRGSVVLPGLRARVQVYRDGFGIPYVFAENDADLFFAQGFVTAQDRLWQMDFERHLAQGRLSDFFGPAAGPTDSLLGLSVIRRAAEQAVRVLPEYLRRMYDRYTAGVNACIGIYRTRPPIEYILLKIIPEAWEPEDCIVVYKGRQWQENGQWIVRPFFDELAAVVDARRFRELAADLRPAPAATVYRTSEWNRFLRSVIRAHLMPPPSSGNRCWAVPSDRSATAKPLLSIVTRNALTVPSPWYEIYLRGGSYRLYGLSRPGYPLVAAGRNGAVAWGWNDEPLTDPEYDFRPAAHPPAIAWPGGEGTDDGAALEALCRADGRTAFENAVGMFGRRPQSVVFADTTGQTGIRTAGGWNRSGQWAEPALRVRQTLSGGEPISTEILKRMQSDPVSDYAGCIVERLRAMAVPDSFPDAFEKQMLESLLRWDGASKPGSPEAALFHAFVLKFTEDAYRDEMGDSLFATFQDLPALHAACVLRTLSNPASAWFDDVRTAGRTETPAGILTKAFRKALSELKERWGPDEPDWSWAGLHSLTFRHPLAERSMIGWIFPIGPFAVGGAADAACSFDTDLAHPYRVEAGPSARMLVDLSDTDNTVSVCPPGVSGQRFDAHYQDQIQIYLTAFYHSVLWDSVKIAQSGWDRLILEPEVLHAAE